MLGAVHEYRMLILESHIDTFGHVNNAAYLEILEEARWDLITRNGYGLDEVQRLRIGPVVLDVHVRFLRELRNRQAITIRSWMDSYSGKIGRFAQQVLDDAGDLCCDAKFTIGLFDLTARRLIRPTPEWVRALGLRPQDLGADAEPLRPQDC
jgi:YbgC/YbaW family acyl-CoA thioester hydrolase